MSEQTFSFKYATSIRHCLNAIVSIQFLWSRFSNNEEYQNIFNHFFLILERLKTQRQEDTTTNAEKDYDFGASKPSNDYYEYEDDYKENLPNSEKPQDFAEMPRTVQSTTEEDDLAHTSTIDIVQPTIGNQNKNVFKNNLIFLYL